MPVTFIGDVHGWSDRVDHVVAQAEGELIFMGDLVDRGPDARGTIDRVRELCASGRARCLMGNHEYALVRSLGVPLLGITEDPALYRAWCVHFGGHAVLASFGVPDADPERLRRALGDRLMWLALRPWLIEGVTDGRAWAAVHASLDARQWSDQRAQLLSGWAADDGWPHWLFDKQCTNHIPPGFPDDTCLVSGHVPLQEVFISSRRILCDTSGGRAGLSLSGVIWPAGRIIRSG